MKALIVEDEDLAALQLKKILEDFDGNISVLAIIQTTKELKNWLDSGVDADLIFCDIELRDGNVLPLLADARLHSAVVFTTAYDQYWKSALQANGIDYLLKPINEEKVHAVLNKFSSLKKVFTGGNKEIISELTSYINQSLARSFKKRFPVRLGSEVFILDIEDIVYFKISNGVILAHTSGQKKLPVSEQTLNELEAVLDPQLFFRINRSELIHIHYVESIQLVTQEDCLIKLKGAKEKLVVSSSRVTQLKNWINL